MKRTYTQLSKERTYGRLCMASGGGKKLRAGYLLSGLEKGFGTGHKTKRSVFKTRSKMSDLDGNQFEETHGSGVGVRVGVRVTR